MNLGHLDYEVVSGFDIRISDLPQLLQPPIEQYVGNDPRTKLRCSIKYDPLGNRVYKKSTASGSATERKHVVDITGELPVILMELNGSGGIVKTYVYANSEVIAQHDGDTSADRYFYLHDRLGSVRLLIDDQGAVQKYCTYEPFGQVIESSDGFMFTGQYFDSEIEEYYLRARQYNPRIARFTSRDPVAGQFKGPLTLHKYLYCMSDPVNRIDPSGEKSLTELTPAMGARATAFGGAAYNFGSAVMQRAQMVYNWAYVKTYELLCIANGIYPSAGSGEQQGFDPLSITPQKLQHIFGNAEHNLGPLHKQYGSSEKDAYIAIQRAVQAGVEAGKYKEGQVVQTVVEVGGVLVKVGGRVMSGVYDFKTAYLWE